MAGAGVVEVGTVAGGGGRWRHPFGGGVSPSDSRRGLCRPGESRAAARAGRAVVKGGSEFAGPRGWFVSKRGNVIDDVLHVLVLVVVVGRVVGVIVGVFRWGSLRIVIQELALDGADDGADPIVEGAFALAFRWVMGAGRGGCRWGHCGSSARDIAHG